MFTSVLLPQEPNALTTTAEEDITAAATFARTSCHQPLIPAVVIGSDALED